MKRRIGIIITIMSLLVSLMPFCKVVKGDESSVTIVSGPEITGAEVSKGFLKKSITIRLAGNAEYYYDNDPSNHITNDIKIVKLYRNGELVAKQSTTGYEVVFARVPVSYDKKDAIKVELYMSIDGQEVEGPSKVYNIQSDTLGKNKCFATKLNSKKVKVRWAGAEGATGYQVMMGKKVVKNVGAKTFKVTISKKKAAKKKYSVIPILKSDGKTYQGSSNSVKPKKNQVKYNINTHYGAYKYWTCEFVVGKVSLKGKTYTVTGYAPNNRMVDLKKYKKLYVSMTVDGKKAFKKTYKNKKMVVRKFSTKKVVLKIKGKANMDLANGSITLSIGYNPIWNE